MHIAVTGATGFLGRYIVNRLLDDGHRVRGWARATSDRGGFVDAGDHLELVEGELNDPAATDALVEGAQAVVHAALAWQQGGDLVAFAERNIVGSLRLMQAAKAAGAKRFVFISTCSVHDRILDDRPLDEAHPLWSYSHYGAHKAAIEKFVHSFGLPDKDWGICALRPTGIYGLRRPTEQSRWYGLIQDVVQGRPVRSAHGGKEVHAEDVARCVDLLLRSDLADVAGEAFNCYDLYVADQEVAQIAKAASGSSSEIEQLNRGPRHQIDTTKIRALGATFGGQAQLKNYVQTLVEEIQERRGL